MAWHIILILPTKSGFSSKEFIFMETSQILLFLPLIAMLSPDMQLLVGLCLQYLVSVGLFKVEESAHHIVTNIMKVFMISTWIGGLRHGSFTPFFDHIIWTMAHMWLYIGGHVADCLRPTKGANICNYYNEYDNVLPYYQNYSQFARSRLAYSRKKWLQPNQTTCKSYFDAYSTFRCNQFRLSAVWYSVA